MEEKYYDIGSKMERGWQLQHQPQESLKTLQNIETTKAHASKRRSELAAAYILRTVFDISDIRGCSERLPDAQSLPIS